MNSKTAVIAGSSGLVGNALLKKLLDSDLYSKVTVLVRSQVPIEHPKLQQSIVNFSQLTAHELECDDVFCCLGTTMKTAGSKDAFRLVDYDFPVNLATVAKAAGAKRFFLVSAAGADANSRIFYSKVKGQTEAAISAIEFSSVYIFRPSMLLGNRKEFRLGEYIGKMLMKSLSFLIPSAYKGIEAEQVAQSMLLCALKNETGVKIITNKMMLELTHK